MIQQKFELFKVRPFGDVINDALAFGKRYFKQYGYVILIMVIPTYLLGAFIYASALSSYSVGSGAALSNLRNLGFLGVIAYLILALGGILLHLVFIVTFMLVEDSPDGQIDHSDIIRGVKENFGRMLSLSWIFFFLFILIGAIIALIFYSLISVSAVALVFLLFLGLFVLSVYVLVPLSMSSIIYVREGLSFGDTVSRAFYLVKKNFWWTFLGIFISGLIGYMLAMVFAAPYMIFTVTKTITTIQTGRMSFEMGILDRVIMALGQFGTIALSTFLAITINIQYYSLVEKKDGVTVLKQIEDIAGSEDNVNDIS